MMDISKEHTMNGEDLYVSQEKIFSILKKAQEYTNEAYRREDIFEKQEYLGYLKASLDTLCTIFDPTEDEIERYNIQPETNPIKKFFKP
jgi:hypothetical protein